MIKELIIHIGHFKTGTTALQVFLEENLAFFEAHGVDYAPIWRTYAKHSDYAFSVLRAAGVRKLLHGYAKPITPRAMWQQLYDHVMASRFGTTLISSEEIIRIGQFPAAVDILRDRIGKSPTCFVFSNDPDWARDNLDLGQETVIVAINAEATGHFDMHLMALCAHNVIANSTFSWWGAWLNATPGKLVIAPRQWFAQGKADNPDLCPADWLRL